MSKLLPVAVCAVLTVGLSAFATDYDRYVDWQFTPVIVNDTNANDNVRHEMDFTKPVHGPWLSNPCYDSATISFITRIKCGAALEYRVKGTEEWSRKWNTSYGMVDYSDVMHAFHLDSLKPGTEYEYRLLTAISGCENYATSINIGRETYTFKTMDPKRDRYSVWVTADLHGSARLCLDPMYERSDAKDADFYVLLGDNVEDRFGNEAMFYITFGFIDDITRIWGTSKPTVFVRGNHDASGLAICDWARFFSTPSGHAYHAFAQGPALFVVLDTNREWQNTPAGREQQGLYIQEQIDFLKTLKRTDMWKKSKFRIVMNHFGVTPKVAESSNVTPELLAELNDSAPQGRIHLFLAGHTHAYSRHDPFDDKLKGVPTDGRKLPQSQVYEEALGKVGFCQVIGKCGEALTIDVAPDKLIVKSHDWSKPGLPLHDACEIKPDGKVVDLPLDK